jgi:hypothetical protein
MTAGCHICHKTLPPALMACHNCYKAKQFFAFWMVILAEQLMLLILFL